MANEEFTAKFKVDISDLKKNITEATKQIKLANATFNAETSGMDKWSKDADGLGSKLKQLKTVLEGQKTILASYKSQLEAQQKAYTENGNRAEQLKAKLKELADQGVSKTSEEYKKYEAALKQVVKEQQNNEKAIDKLNIDILEQEAAVGKTEKEIRNYEQALDTLDDQLDEVGDSAENASGGFTVMKGALANLVADGIRMAISAMKDFVTETIEVGKQFDKSMSNVAALSGASEKELSMLRDTAKEFGSTTQFSASQAADALGYMALAGWDAEQSADALGGVLDLAAASNMDLAKASDMVTDYMSAFGMEADKSAYFADLLAYAQANANTTAEGLGEAFKNSAANMNAAGQDIETVTSLLSMMANQGLKGSEAGTALTAVMRDMTAKMKDGAIAIGDTQVQVMDAEGNYRDLTDILLDVEAATAGMGDAQKASALASTFTSDSIKGLNLILNAGVGEAASFEEQLRKSGGSAKEMADIMNDNLSGDLTALGSKFEGIQISLYEKFEPALRAGVDALSGMLDGLSWVIEKGGQFMDWLNSGSVGAEAFKVVVIALTAAFTAFMAVLGAQAAWTGLIALIGKVKAGFVALNATMAANPIGLVIAAVVALVAAFAYLWKNSEKFRNFWINLWKKIKAAVVPVVKALVEWFSQAWEKIKKVWSVVAEWFGNVWKKIKDAFKDTVTWFKELFTKAWNNIKQAWSSVTKWFSDIWTSIKNAFKDAATWFKTLFTQAWTNIKNAWSSVVKWFTDIWTSIKKAFADVATWFKTLFTDAWNNIKQAWSSVTKWFSDIWVKIKEIFSGVATWFKEKFTAAWTNIKDAWSGVKTWFSDLWGKIKDTFSGVGGWFKEKFTDAWKKIKGVFSGWGEYFGGLWETVKGKFTDFGTKISASMENAVKNVINKAIGAIETAVNKGIRFINKAIGLVNKLLPGSPVGEVSEVSLPRLAKGGVLKKGQVGLLEGSGAEAVVPLERNKRWINAVTSEMLRQLKVNPSAVNSGSITTSNVQNFTQNIYAPKQPSRIELYRQTQNLLELAKAKG